MIFFDTETTQLVVAGVEDPAAQPRIIEIGAISYRVGRPRSSWPTFSRLINPGVLLPEKVTKITGLTDAQLATCPEFAEVIIDLIDFFRADPSNTLVAHNFAFDHGVLVYELRRHGWEHRFPYPWFQVDTCAQFAANAKLEKWAEKLGVLKAAQTHRALDDAWLMLDCYLAATTADRQQDMFG